jgi:hypothetical protein
MRVALLVLLALALRGPGQAGVEAATMAANPLHRWCNELSDTIDPCFSSPRAVENSAHSDETLSDHGATEALKTCKPP